MIARQQMGLSLEQWKALKGIDQGMRDGLEKARKETTKSVSSVKELTQFTGKYAKINKVLNLKGADGVWRAAKKTDFMSEKLAEQVANMDKQKTVADKAAAATISMSDIMDQGFKDMLRELGMITSGLAKVFGAAFMTDKTLKQMNMRDNFNKLYDATKDPTEKKKLANTYKKQMDILDKLPRKADNEEIIAALDQIGVNAKKDTEKKSMERLQKDIASVMEVSKVLPKEKGTFGEKVSADILAFKKGLDKGASQEKLQELLQTINRGIKTLPLDTQKGFSDSMAALGRSMGAKGEKETALAEEAKLQKAMQVDTIGIWDLYVKTLSTGMKVGATALVPGAGIALSAKDMGAGDAIADLGGSILSYMGISASAEEIAELGKKNDAFDRKAAEKLKKDSDKIAEKGVDTNEKNTKNTEGIKDILSRQEAKEKAELEDLLGKMDPKDITKAQRKKAAIYEIDLPKSKKAKSSKGDQEAHEDIMISKSGYVKLSAGDIAFNPSEAARGMSAPAGALAGRAMARLAGGGGSGGSTVVNRTQTNNFTISGDPEKIKKVILEAMAEDKRREAEGIAQ